LALEHDPEKWKAVFPRDKREAFAPEIMLKQRDEYHGLAALPKHETTP
jgi:hypothetical protein